VQQLKYKYFYKHSVWVLYSMSSCFVQTYLNAFFFYSSTLLPVASSFLKTINACYLPLIFWIGIYTSHVYYFYTYFCFWITYVLVY